MSCREMCHCISPGKKIFFIPVLTQAYEKMMGRLEKRYCWIMDILAWGHGKYTKEQLEQLTMPELAEIHSQVYNQRLDEIQSVHL